MKRKLTLFLCAVMIAACSAFALTACFGDDEGGDGGSKGHQHSFVLEVAEKQYLKEPANCQHPALYYHACECGARGGELFSYGDVGGHTFEEYEHASDPTCVKNGTETAKCVYCDATDTREIPDTATGKHVFKNYTYDENATCVKNGTETAKCAYCDATDTRVKANSATGVHIFSDYVSDGNSDCSHDGTETAECETCTATDTRTKELGMTDHAYNNGECSVCGAKISNGLEYTLSDDKTYYTVTGIGTATDTELYIPNRYNGLPVTGVAVGAFKNNAALLGVTFGNGLVSVGERAFNGCAKLTHIALCDSVRVIGAGAFAGCSSLSSVTAGSGLNIADSISADAFDNCPVTTVTAYPALISVLPKSSLVTATVSGDSLIERLFYNCSALETVNISDGVEHIGKETFYGCVSLKEISIHAGVKEIGEAAFYGCSSLKEISIPDSVAKIGASAFEGCSSIGTLTAGKGLTNYDQIGNSAFKGCTSIETVSACSYVIYYVPKVSLKTVTVYGTYVLGRLLENCRSVEKVVISDGVTSIGEQAFCYCTSLESVTIPNGVTTIGKGVFANCTSLSSITVPDSVKGIGASAFANCISLESITIPYGVTDIDERAFYGCTLFKSITVPDSVREIGESAFENCTAVREVTLGKGIKNIDYTAFKIINVENGKSFIEKINYTGNMADWCAIESLGGITENGHSGRKLFIGGKEIKGEIVIPSGVKRIPAGAFCCCPITGISIPDGVTEIGYEAFRECTSLKNMTIPDGVTEIGSEAFFDCFSLKNITIPDGVTVIEGYTFYRCGLTSFVIPDSVTKIDGSAFSGLGSLTEIVIPETVTEIAGYTFGSECLTVYCEAAAKPADWADYWNGDCPVVWDCKNNDADGEGNVYTVVDGLRYMLKEGEATLVKQAAYLEEIIIPEEITYKNKAYAVTAIGNEAFSSTAITSVTIPSSVKAIGDYAFISCNLNNLRIEGEGVTVGNNAFTSCPIKTATVPADVLGSIDFNESLESVVITGGDSITSGAFSGSYYLSSITLPSSVIKICNAAFVECHSLTRLVIPESVTEIEDNAFTENASLTLYCEAAVKPVGWANDWYSNCPVVWDCKNNDRDENGYAYTLVDGIRYSVKDGKATVAAQPRSEGKIVNVVIPASVTYKDVEYKVTEIADNAFVIMNTAAQKMKSITLPDGLEVIGNSAFLFCGKLESINIPDSVKKIGGGAFDECVSLVQTEKGIKYVGNWVIGCDSSVTEPVLRSDTRGIADNALSGGKFTNIELPQSLVIIGGRAFSDSSLKAIELPQSVKYIDAGAFSGCTNITSFVIPDEVTRIEEYTFDVCGKLQELTIPAGVNYIGKDALQNCVALTDIYFKGTQQQWEAIEKGEYWNNNVFGCTVHYNAV